MTSQKATPSNKTSHIMLTKSQSRAAYKATNGRLLNEWANALSLKLGRSVEGLKAQGLTAHDFKMQTVAITFEDGSSASWKYAFYVQDPAMPDWVAVFTEHCGYYEFYLTDEDTVSIISPQGRSVIPPSISSEEWSALNRFQETLEDGAGYDVAKQMMRRLAEIGLVYQISPGRFGLSEYGYAVINGRPG
jgi:hypothetical protein